MILKMTIIERYDDMNEYDYVDVVEIVNSSISKTNNNTPLTLLTSAQWG